MMESIKALPNISETRENEKFGNSLERRALESIFLENCVWILVLKNGRSQ